MIGSLKNHAIAFALILTMGQGAMAAAPFCTQSQTTAPQCYYYDATNCRKDANTLGGICVVNEESINLPEGYGNYCLVISTEIVECLYLDRSSCDSEAKRQNGVCLRNNSKPAPLPSYEYQSEDAYQPF